MNERSLLAMKYKLDLMNFVTLSIDEIMWLHSFMKKALFRILIAVFIAIKSSDRQVWSNWELYKGFSVTAAMMDVCAVCFRAQVFKV